MEELIINYPEMHGKTNTDVQAIFSNIINKYRVTSKNKIELKRGITENGIVEKIGANGMKNKNYGWFKYHMTEKAFQKFTQETKTTLNILLD